MMAHDAMDHDDSASREIERLRLEVRAAERRGAERALEWVAEHSDEMYDKAILIEEGLAALYPDETESV